MAADVVERSPLDRPQTENSDHGDDESEEETVPQAPVEIGSKRRLASRYLGALLGTVRVVEFLDVAMPETCTSPRSSRNLTSTSR